MDTKNKTILFIDDEEYRMEPHAEYLRLHGYDVIYAASFNEALEEAKTNLGIINLIILDIMIPIDGVELTEEEEIIADDGSKSGFVLLDHINKLMDMKKIGRIKTIILTIRNDIRDEIEKYSIDNYLTKPISAEKLLEVINDTLVK